MFLKKFPENTLIKKIKISGSFISVYIPEDQLNDFKNSYPVLGYNVLWVGEGVMHDFAHNSRNKHMSFLEKNPDKVKHGHFHFQLPTIVDPANLETFLNFFDTIDLSKEQKDQFIQEYVFHTSTPSIEQLSELIKPYYYIFNAVLYSDPYLNGTMPLLNDFMKSVDAYLTLKDHQLHNLPSTISIGNQKINSEEANEIFTTLMKHVNILMEFELILKKPNINTAEVIHELNKLFLQASTDPFPCFNKLPYLYNELVANLLFIDDGFNVLYTTLCQQLNTLLNTTELQFTPQILNEDPKTTSYKKAIFLLNKHGSAGQTIMNSMARLKEGENNYWNPYWINSSAKLQSIVNAVLKIEQGANIDVIMQDKDSELYSALNTPRLLPVTFLGKFGINKTKSLMQTEDTIRNLNDIQSSLH